MHQVNEFQSTPPAEARGDYRELAPRKQIFTNLFQSTPPAEARGDPPSGCRVGDSCHSFNPLPPPKRGETSIIAGDIDPNWFQSTPPAEARGDSVPRVTSFSAA